MSPAVPSKEAKAKAVGEYIVDLHSAHRDCEAKLNGVRRIVEVQ